MPSSNASKDDDELIRDIDHCDDLCALRDRLLGLRCAIYGASIADTMDRNGLHRLASDIIESLEVMREAFAIQRGVKQPQTNNHSIKASGLE